MAWPWRASCWFNSFFIFSFISLHTSTTFIQIKTSTKCWLSSPLFWAHAKKQKINKKKSKISYYHHPVIFIPDLVYVELDILGQVAAHSTQLSGADRQVAGCPRSTHLNTIFTFFLVTTIFYRIVLWALLFLTVLYSLKNMFWLYLAPCGKKSRTIHMF